VNSTTTEPVTPDLIQRLVRGHSIPPASTIVQALEVIQRSLSLVAGSRSAAVSDDTKATTAGWADTIGQASLLIEAAYLTPKEQP
jgi:hypothetical protein